VYFHSRFVCFIHVTSPLYSRSFFVLHRKNEKKVPLVRGCVIETELEMSWIKVDQPKYDHQNLLSTLNRGIKGAKK